MSKNISFFITTLNAGGAERVVSYLSNNLCNKYTVHIVLLYGGIQYKIDPKIKIKSLGLKADQKNVLKLFYYPYYIYKYYKYCTRNRILISHSFLDIPNFINCIVKFFNKPLKTVLGVRTNLTKNLEGRTKYIQYMYKKITTLLYGNANLIITNSLHAKTDLEDNFRLNRNIATVYNPLDLDYINYVKNKKISNSLNEDEFKILSVANFRPEKNHELLIKALALIDENVSLYLIGNGDFSKLETLAKQLNVFDRVYFLGFQDNPYAYLAKMNCLILTSNYEGLPNTLLEGLVCGIPIISTASDGAIEVLNPSNRNIEVRKSICAEFGILIPIRTVQPIVDSIKTLYNDYELRENYSKKGLSRASDFNLQKIIIDYSNLLFSI